MREWTQATHTLMQAASLLVMLIEKNQARHKKKHSSKWAFDHFGKTLKVTKEH
jgi:hypothetical protein